MRLIQLAAHDVEQAGSFVPLVRAILTEAEARGWRADAVFPASAGERPWFRELESTGAAVHLVPASGRATRARPLARLLAETNGPTLMHTHFTGFDLPALLAARGGRRAALIWHLHTVLGEGAGARLRNALKLGFGGRRVDAILCPSEAIAGDIARAHGPRERVQVFPTPIDGDSFLPADDEFRAAARRQLDLSPEADVLLHFGWEWRLKGGDLLLRSVRELLEGGTEVTVISRAGEEGREAVRAAGLEGTVRVLDFVEDGRQLFAAADVLVSSSLTEGMAFAVLEAICSGTPVVATAIPGHAFLSDLPGCAAVNPDPSALAAAIREALAADPARRRRELGASRELVLARFGVDAYLVRLFALYESTLAASPRA